MAGKFELYTDKAGEFFNDYGGHNYVNFEGRFSRWNEEFDENPRTPESPTATAGIPTFPATRNRRSPPCCAR